MEKDMEVSSFGLVRYFKFIQMNFYIMWRTLVEYKVNFYSSVIGETINMIVMFFLFKVIYLNFNEVIPWVFEDFILYFTIYAIVFTIAGIFMFKEPLSELLKFGDLNGYLIRPIKVEFFYISTKLSSPGFVMIFVYFTFFIFTVIYYQIVLVNYLLSVVIILLLVLLNIVYYLFLYSFDLWFINSYTILLSPVNRIRSATEGYPEPFLRSSGFKYILFCLTPMFFVGSLLIPILRGYGVWRINLQFGIIISLIVLFGFGFFLNWHYGLKRYEAFG